MVYKSTLSNFRLEIKKLSYSSACCYYFPDEAVKVSYTTNTQLAFLGKLNQVSELLYYQALECVCREDYLKFFEVFHLPIICPTVKK